MPPGGKTAFDGGVGADSEAWPEFTYCKQTFVHGLGSMGNDIEGPWGTIWRRTAVGSQ